MAQQVAATLDKNDPELRAILTEIEADTEKARVKANIPGMSIIIVYDQDVLLAKGYGYREGFLRAHHFVAFRKVE